MRAVLFPEVRKILIKEVEIPKINDDEVLLKNSYAGLCGTDIHIYNGDFFSSYPLIPGHEFSGVIEEIGSNVKNFKRGDKVVVYPNISCNTCYYCQRNEQNFCLNLKSYGVTTNGGFAEYSKILASNLHKIENIGLKEAALLEPLGCVIYGLRSIKVNYGDKALVFGAGPIGLIILQLLKISGVSGITMVDINNKKMKIAKDFGADEFLWNDKNLDKKLKSISYYGYDILIDATGNSRVCEQLFKYANKRARLLFYGVCEKDKTISISPYQIYRNDLSVFGAFSLNKTIPSAIELVKNKKINLKSLISHELELSEFNEIFKIMDSGDFLKIIFKC